MKKIVLSFILATVFSFTLSAATHINLSNSGCSIAGTASATKDSICVNGSTTLILTGYFGAIQWQSFNGAIWIDEIGAGATTDNYTVTLSASTDYRAVHGPE